MHSAYVLAVTHNVSARLDAMLALDRVVVPAIKEIKSRLAVIGPNDTTNVVIAIVVIASC